MLQKVILADGGKLAMAAPCYDIFRRDDTGDPVWIEAVADLDTAKGRIIELSSAAPGQYVVFSQRSGRMVSSGTVVSSPTARDSRKVLQLRERDSETRW